MSFKQECQNLLDHYVTYYQARDAKGCASLYAAHAEMYSPFGPPAIGRRAIEDAHAEWVMEGSENKKITVSSANRDGDLGWCVAQFSEGTTGEGISLNVLSRQPDGSWLITHCSLNEAQSQPAKEPSGQPCEPQ
ncbi:nuclear transport factor 2 family protein [Roseovarius aestuariivivens]|uniref:YybH family protein n=1 Tax=Roseovarius aestuariivivens TaxID=1888910 RepID=UPI0010810583